jgi:copper homeostasis protein (lipoprotein)
VAAVLVAAIVPVAEAADVIRGTATYRERMALPTGAVLEVTLEDVSRMDAPTEVMGRVEIANPGNPPFTFEIPYEADAVDDRHTYSVRARITLDGRLLFTTDTVAPVLTRGAGTEVELLLKRVGGGSSPAAAARSRALTGSFVGTLPCADCEGIEVRIDLFEDGAYYRRMTYLGKGDDAVAWDIGSWAPAADGSRVALFGDDREPEQWKVVDRSVLRKLDLEGREIESALNYDLSRTDGLEPMEPRLAMRGMYMYMADAAMFRECLTGRRFPVAMEGASIDVERAYLEARHGPGAEVLVSVVGRLAPRPPMEGDGTVEMLVVDEFDGIWPGETCGARMSVSELLDNYWKLTRLGDQPVVVEPQLREPHLVLRSDGQVTGSTGCNQLTGPYTVDGSMISFGPLAMTQRACLQGMETEAAFARALNSAVRFRLLAHHLELLDAEGTTVARLEARELR